MLLLMNRDSFENDEFEKISKSTSVVNPSESYECSLWLDAEELSSASESNVAKQQLVLIKSPANSIKV
jgi:hypothetical protein